MPNYRPSQRRGVTGQDAEDPAPPRYGFIQPHANRDSPTPTERKIAKMKEEVSNTPKIG